MRLIETFLLDIRPGDDEGPAKVRIAVPHMAAAGGRMYLTPACISLDEVEGQINALQDELDQLRERARRAYQTGR
jgi:hypothetical protein